MTVTPVAKWPMTCRNSACCTDIVIPRVVGRGLSLATSPGAANVASGGSGPDNAGRVEAWTAEGDGALSRARARGGAGRLRRGGGGAAAVPGDRGLSGRSSAARVGAVGGHLRPRESLLSHGLDLPTRQVAADLSERLLREDAGSQAKQGRQAHAAGPVQGRRKAGPPALVPLPPARLPQPERP